jgi:hypothetical protein
VRIPPQREFLTLTAETEEFARSIGIDPRPNCARAGIFNLGALQATDWKTLAKMAGEPVDLAALGQKQT